MIFGFTGTRQGLTERQRGALGAMMRAERIPETVLHGGAIGADTEFDELVLSIWGLCPWQMEPDDRPDERVVCEVYPANSARYTFFRWKNQAFRKVHDIKDPLKRNRIIVNRADRMIACPAEAKEQPRGGTWSTIRYTRKAGKPLTIIVPSGKMVEEAP